MLQSLGIPLGVVAVLGVFALVAIVILAVGARSLLVAYRLHRAEPTPVMDLANVSRRVEVVGAARTLDETVTAPFSGRETLVCEWSVLEERPDDDGSDWHTIASGTDAVPFLLDDGTATVFVDPTDADLHLARQSPIRVEGGEAPPDAVQRFIDANEDVDDEDVDGVGIGPIRMFRGRDRRYVERRLDPDEDCLVYATPTYDTSVADRARQVNARFSADDGELVLTDADEAETAQRFLRNGAIAVVVGLVILGLVLAFASGALRGSIVVG